MTAAMILAAGLGTRLRPWTEHHPKALVPVKGVPMLSRVIDRMRELGVERIVVNVHHHAEQIIQWVAEHCPDVLISDERGMLLGSGGALVHALPLLEGVERLLVHNCDVYTSCFPYRSLLDWLAELDAVMATEERSSARALAFGPLLLGRAKNHPEGLPMAYSGIQAMRMSVIRGMAAEHPGGTRFEYPEYYINHLPGLRVGYVMPSGPGYVRIDVGTPAGLAAAEAAK